MSLIKLRPELIELLPERGISELNTFQMKVIDALKSGKNILATGPEGCGKTTSILLSLLHKINMAGEGSPRAIVVCSTDQNAIDLHAEIKRYCRVLDLTVDLANDKGNQLQQRNDIFDGTEIIIGTAKRIYDLYIQNGINVSQLKMFILDDAISLFKNGHKMRLDRIVESLPKCQHLIFSTTLKDYRAEEFIEEFVPYSVLIEGE